MMKLTVSGTKNDLRWFLKVLGKDPRFDLNDTSNMFEIAGSDKYKRVYTNVYRKQVSTTPNGRKRR